MAFLIPLIASLAPTGAQMGIEYAMAKDQARREEESQRQLEAYFRKQEEAYQRDQDLIAKMRQAEADKIARDNEKNMNILQQGKAKQQEIERQRSLENQQRIERERIQSQEQLQQRLAKDTEQKLAEQHRIAMSQTENKQRLLEEQNKALQQKGAIFDAELQKMAQLRQQQLDQTKQQQQEQLRLRQEVLNRELQQKTQLALQPQMMVARRKVPVVKTTSLFKRGRGTDPEMIKFLMDYYKVSMKEAKKIHKKHF